MKKRIILTIFILGLIILGIGIFLLTRKNEYTVTFITNSDTEIREQKIRKNEYASKPNDPIKDGYEFSGWYLDNFLFDFTTKITENITLSVNEIVTSKGFKVASATQSFDYDYKKIL